MKTLKTACKYGILRRVSIRDHLFPMCLPIVNKVIRIVFDGGEGHLKLSEVKV